MADKHCLGIYYSEQELTAVVAKRQGATFQVVSEVKLAIPEPASSEEATDEAVEPASSSPAILKQLSLKLQPGGSKRHPVALALESAFYQTQHHHSEFAEAKQIRQTLRFDIEEDFVIDAESVSLCFELIPTSGAGADMMVHTAPREALKELLGHFEEAGLDALAAAPDTTCWLHYLRQGSVLPEGEAAVVVARSEDTFYLLVLNEAHRPILSRSCYCPAGDEAAEFLSAELRRSLTQIPSDQKPVKLFYHRKGSSPEQVSRWGRDTSLEVRALPEEDVTRAFALGAAIGWMTGEVQTDFRSDGMGPRTLERAQEKAKLGLVGALCLLLLACIAVMRSHAQAHRQDILDADARLVAAWKQTHPTSTKPAPRNISQRMKAEDQRLNDSATPKTAEALSDSASYTLLLLLETLDVLPKDFDLQIKSLNVRGRRVILSGSVPNIKDQIQQFNAIRKAPRFQEERWDFSTSSDNRREFNITMRRTTNSPSPEVASRGTQS